MIVHPAQPETSVPSVSNTALRYLRYLYAGSCAKTAQVVALFLGVCTAAARLIPKPPSSPSHYFITFNMAVEKSDVILIPQSFVCNLFFLYVNFYYLLFIPSI